MKYSNDVTGVCLNPCYTGKWFLRYEVEEDKIAKAICLNPCYTGKWFLRGQLILNCSLIKYVLILVILENGF